MMKFGYILGIILAVLAILAFMALLIMLVWNVLADYFGFKQITYVIAVVMEFALVILAQFGRAGGGNE